MASETKVKFVGLVPFDEIVDFIRFRMEDVIGLVYFKTEIIQKNEKPYSPLKYPDIVVNGTKLIEQKVLMEVLYHNKKYRILYNYKNYIKFNIDEVFNNFKHGTPELNDYPQTELVIDSDSEILDIMPRIAYDSLLSLYIASSIQWKRYGH